MAFARNELALRKKTCQPQVYENSNTDRFILLVFLTSKLVVHFSRLEDRNGTTSRRGRGVRYMPRMTGGRVQEWKLYVLGLNVGRAGVFRLAGNLQERQ